MKEIIWFTQTVTGHWFLSPSFDKLWQRARCLSVCKSEMFITSWMTGLQSSIKSLNGLLSHYHMQSCRHWSPFWSLNQISRIMPTCIFIKATPLSLKLLYTGYLDHKLLATMDEPYPFSYLLPFKYRHFKNYSAKHYLQIMIRWLFNFII